MKQTKPVGQQAATRKYDLLTALGVHACRSDKNLQRLVLRFVTLIVARYNWQHDELSIGQREIAQLWSVDERTVKRDMTKLRAMGWITQKRAAARGRVAVHGLDLQQILMSTETAWPLVGTDFVSRMQGDAPNVSLNSGLGNVVAFRGATANASATLQSGRPQGDGSAAWLRAKRRLQQDDPALFDAWFHALNEGSALGEVFEVVAPSRFHASYLRAHHSAILQAALQREGMAMQGLLITTPAGA